MAENNFQVKNLIAENAIFQNRPTVGGLVVLLSGESAPLPTAIVYQTGDQTISGFKTFTGGFVASTGTFVDKLTLGSQQIYPHGLNGFSVNEDYDPSNSSTQTAYHFTSGPGRETVAFSLARTANFTDGFGIYGTSADNKFVSFGETANTTFEWRKNVGIQPINLSGGGLLMSLDPNGNLSVSGNIYLSGNSVLTGVATGAFLTTGAADLRYVDLTSSQTISGQKTFEHELSVKELLTVETTGALNIVADTFSESAGSIIRTRRARGSIESPSAVLDSDVIGNFSFAAHNGTEFPTASAAIKAKAYGNQTSTNSAAYLAFETRASGAGGQLLERIVISDDGMVGINNSSPSTQLYVQGSGTISNASQSFVPVLFIDGYGLNNSFRQRRAGGSFASMSAISSGTALGNNQFFGATGSTFHSNPSAFIRARAGADFSNTSTPAILEFATNQVGSTDAAQVRMTIASDGNVGIGTDIPTEKLTVVGNISASGYNNLPCEFIVACSDETTDLTTGLATTFRAPYAFNFTGARASVTTAPSGSAIIVDINNEGNSMFLTGLSIDSAEKTSATAATPPVIDATYANVSDDAEITIDIDQIGATIAGAGLKVTLYGVRA